MTVTSSISQRKATSAGVRPEGEGEAIGLRGRKREFGEEVRRVLMEE